MLHQHPTTSSLNSFPQRTPGTRPDRYPTQQTTVHPYARLPSHREVSQPRSVRALQDAGSSMNQQAGREIQHVHNPALRVPSRTQQQVPRSVSTNKKEEDTHVQQTLYKPKSKLRLRLKLTPPHPPGTKLLIPTAPLPSHITMDDPLLLKALAPPVKKKREKENGSEGSFGNAFELDTFEIAQAEGKKFPPIHAQARAHQAYQRAQLGHGRARAPGQDETAKERVRSEVLPKDYELAGKKSDQLMEASTNDERIRAIEEAGQRRQAPSPPLEAQPPIFSSLNKRNDQREIVIPGEGKFYQLEPTPIVQNEREPSRETSLDMSMEVSRIADEELDRDGEEMETKYYLEDHSAESTFTPNKVQDQQGHRKPEQIETRNIHEVRDSSFENSGQDDSAVHETGESSWTSSGADDSGVAQSDENKSQEVSDVLSLSDQMLADRYKFGEEIGFGNWGSVWGAKPRKADYHPALRHTTLGLPPISQAIAAQHISDKIAVKLVYRKKDPTTSARVRALWSEMKVIRTLRDDPHPSIIGFDSFIITPSYALVIMPYLSHCIPVGLPEETARPYFGQLTSAIAYLHDRGITHNDIKPANIMISYADVPVLVDFGFAQRWDLQNSDGKGPIGATSLAVSSNKASASQEQPFWSEISWGTPEYLDPPRALGAWHDERLSDVWALGITFFEILMGRTPFESSANEDCSSQGEMKIYYERSVKGEWLGDWEMSTSMERLLRAMICPDHQKRLTASQATRHVALQSQPHSSELSTPPFVRTATSDQRSKKRKEALPKDNPTTVRSGSVAKRRREPTAVECDPKSVAAGGPNVILKNRIAEAVIVVTPEKRLTVKAQRSMVPEPSRPEVKAEQPHAPHHNHGRMSNSPLRSRTNAMSTIEALSKANLASEPSGQNTLPSRKEVKKIKSFDQLRETRKREQSSEVPTLRRPASAMALASDNIAHANKDEIDIMREDQRARRTSQHRRHTRIVSEGCLRSLIEPESTILPAGVQKEEKKSSVEELRDGSPAKVEKRIESRASQESMVSGTRDTIIRHDAEHLGRLRTLSGHLISSEKLKVPPLPQLESMDPVALDNRLNQIASWVKDVEQIVLEARTALEEVQNDQPRSKTPVQFERSISRLSNLTNRRSVDNFVRLAREGQLPEEEEEKFRATPTHRPSMSMETGHAYHLRRQRSDLTNFRSMQFQPIAEQELPETIPTNTGFRSVMGLDRKLRSHRSTGDLNKMVMDQNEDPYEGRLAARAGVDRTGNGWSNSKSKTKNGHKEEKAKHTDNGHTSRFKTFFKGILKRKD